MARFTVAFLFVYTFVAQISTVLSGPVERRAIVPSLDPFYIPPSGFQSTAPGAILRTRQVFPAFFGLVPQPVQAWQLLYRTTAVDGSAIATVTTVFKPLNAATDKFVSFQTAYDSSATICDPSYQYQLGAAPVDIIASIEQLILQLYLTAGYIVAAADYEGPDAAFGAARLSGTGTLDGMRAVVNFKTTLGLSTSKPAIVGVGYSGGAIATAWAAALQPSYAPELAVKGWVSGGTPANLTGTFVFTDSTIFSGFLPASFAGLNMPSAYRAQANALLTTILTPYGKSKISLATVNCAPADLLNFFDQSVLSTSFQSLGRGILTNPIVASILKLQTLGINAAETPKAPVLLYHASQDEIIPYANATTLSQAWCRNGASVHFTTYAAGGHFTTEILGVPSALQYTQSAFAGTVPTGCSSDTVLSNQLNPVALGANFEPILTKLLQLLADAGNGDANIKQNIRVLTG